MVVLRCAELSTWPAEKSEHDVQKIDPVAPALDRIAREL